MSSLLYGALYLILTLIEVLCLAWSLFTVTGGFTYFTGKEIHPNARTMVMYIGASQAFFIIMGFIVAGLALQTNPSAEACYIGYKMCSITYCIACAFFYYWLFSKYHSVNMEHSIAGHWTDRAMQAALLFGMPAIVLINAIFSYGVLLPVPDNAFDGSSGYYCSFKTPTFVYVLVIGADFVLTILFTFMFVRPLQETLNAVKAVKATVRSTTLVETVLRESLITGIFSVIANFLGILALCLADLAFSGQFEFSLFQVGPAFVAVSNSVHMFYSMRKIWLKPNSRAPSHRSPTSSQQPKQRRMPLQTGIVSEIKSGESQINYSSPRDHRGSHDSTHSHSGPGQSNSGSNTADRNSSDSII